MAVVIWHNPKCSTSRKVLDLLRARGLEPTVIEYLKTPPSAAEIKTVLGELGMKPRELMRRRGTPYDELRLDEEARDAALIVAMAKHPILIERPVVRTPKGTRLCRPPERVNEIL
jgi:arsenate reductase